MLTNRSGAKYFVKPVMEPKDRSWLDSIASMTLKVGKKKQAKFCSIYLLQAVEERKKPAVELPLGETMKTKKKDAVKPDKGTAIAKHQTRMI